MFKKLSGVVLILMILGSAMLALAGTWGWITGDTATQLFATFLIVGGSAIGISWATETFLNPSPQKEK